MFCFSRAEFTVDLDLLEKRLTSASSGYLIQAPFPTQCRGLAGLVESYLERPLNKSDQVR